MGIDEAERPELAASLTEVMRHTPSCRYFEPDPVPPSLIHAVLDDARFASSGGNRQGWRIVVVTDPELRARLAELHRRQWDAYVDHARAGVVGFQGDDSGRLMEHGTNHSRRRLDRTEDFSAGLDQVPVLLVAYVDLATLAITDRHLDRPSVVGGGSLYTLVQNILLGCTARGLGSALTTLLAAEQPAVDELLGVPPGFALGALVAVGWPVRDKLYRRLSRRPVAEIAYDNRWGEQFSPA
jgi:nitroreductase